MIVVWVGYQGTSQHSAATISYLLVCSINQPYESYLCISNELLVSTFFLLPSPSCSPSRQLDFMAPIKALPRGSRYLLLLSSLFSLLSSLFSLLSSLSLFRVERESRESIRERGEFNIQSACGERESCNLQDPARLQPAGNRAPALHSPESVESVNREAE